MAKAKTRKPIGRFVTFILLIALIVGVVLAIVFINLFTPKSTTTLAKAVNEVATSGYLSDSYANNDAIDEYLDEILTLQGTVNNDDLNSEDFVKIENYQNAMEAFQTMSNFFARELVFTTYTSTYKDNASKIQSDLKSAKSEVDDFAEYLEEKLPLTGTASNSALILTWVDCEASVDAILSYTCDAVERMMEVYSSCVDSTLLNNDFSTMLFKISGAYIDELFSQDVQDKSNIGSNLKTIASTYFTTSGERFIVEFSYSASLQSATQDLLNNGRSSGQFSAFMNGTLGG